MKRFNRHVNALWPLQMPHFGSRTPTGYFACSTCIRSLQGMRYQPVTFFFFPFLLRGRLESVERRIPPYRNDSCGEMSEKEGRERLFIITNMTWEKKKIYKYKIIVFHLWINQHGNIHFKQINTRRRGRRERERRRGVSEVGLMH